MVTNHDTEEHEDTLLPVLTRAFPSISSYERIGDRIVQGNAVGNRVLVRHQYDTASTTYRMSEEENAGSLPITSTSSSSSSLEQHLFVKLVDAVAYQHKPWADLRRTLLYARTEVRFYNEFVPLLGLEPLVPSCFHAHCDLGGLIDDDESATAVFSSTTTNTNTSHTNNHDHEKDTRILRGRGGCIILEALNVVVDPNLSLTLSANSNSGVIGNGGSGKRWMQASPLTPQQALQCLNTLAKLHASSWQDKDMLMRASERLCDTGGSYHLQIRNPNELKNMAQSWDHFYDNFQSVAPPELWNRASIRNLGKRIQAIAPHISKQLTPGLSIGEYATIVHGDYKAMNAFLPVPSSSEDDNDDDDNDVYMIDFASAGVGLGMSDVAMHIVHAVRPCDLKDGGEEQLVDGYLCALNAALRRRQTKGGDYPTDVAMRHYRLGCVDYLRFILGRFWRSATLESFEAKKKSQNTTLINRDVDAAMRFIEKVDLYLEEFEQENERD